MAGLVFCVLIVRRQTRARHTFKRRHTPAEPAYDRLALTRRPPKKVPPSICRARQVFAVSCWSSSRVLLITCGHRFEITYGMVIVLAIVSCWAGSFVFDRLRNGTLRRVCLRLCSVPAMFRFLLNCLVDCSIFAVLHVKHSVKVPHSSIVFALDPHDVGAFSFSKVGLKSEIYSALHSTVPCILQLKFAF